jgi:hypothetical protein
MLIGMQTALLSILISMKTGITYYVADRNRSGYCPYPAGALCYRDGRMRYLVTWTSPVIFREGENKKAESIGVYGVEGSKPGAAAGKKITSSCRPY